jgi:GntP family gluconate:H+ symporter
MASPRMSIRLDQVLLDQFTLAEKTDDQPSTSACLGVLFAGASLVLARGGDAGQLRESLGKSLKPIASIIMIIAGGGAFQELLTSAKVSDAIVHLTQQSASLR